MRKNAGLFAGVAAAMALLAMAGLYEWRSGPLVMGVQNRALPQADLKPSAQPQSDQRVVPQSREAVQYSYAPIVRKAAPAVVNVYVSSRVRTFASPFARHPLFRHFFGDDAGPSNERILSSLGSGVLVSPDGVVVTNTHVIKARGETEIRVALSDQREFPARVLAQDEKTDIAVLKIEGDGGDFPYMQFEDSDAVEVGDLVLAIGNPFGIGQTVTSGIISALSRSQLESDAVFIQTDAPINPGNSGGALVDMSGRLIGINTAIFTQSGGSDGIGFAIPSNLVRLYVDSALKGRKIERPWIGARLEDVSREYASALNLSRVAGAIVTRVYAGGPAAEAGIEPGDVITHVDGFAVPDARSVNYRLTTKGAGNVVRLSLIRRGQPMEIELRLAAVPQPKADEFRNLSGQHPLDGARVANISPVIAEELGLNTFEGVVIVGVVRSSISGRLGFRRGDVIVEIGRTPIKSLSDLENALARRQASWRVLIERDGRQLELRVAG